MPSLQASDVITRLTTVQTVDNARPAGSPFKLPTSLRDDVDGDLAELIASEEDTAPREGARAGASGTRRVALTELGRQLRGGYRGIAALDEADLTEAQRLQVFESYGWESGQVGGFDDARTIALARLAPTVSVAEVGGVAARLYTSARLARIAAQLAIVDAAASTATGADRELATLRRDTALDLAGGTLLRVRFFYCSATRDLDATPELVRIGYQPRRGPGQGGDGGGGGGGGLALPSAPQNVVVQSGAAGSGAVTISCDAPPPAEGVTVFRIYRDGTTMLGAVTVVPANFDGFTPGESLTITIRTVNATGEGPASAPVTGAAG